MSILLSLQSKVTFLWFLHFQRFLQRFIDPTSTEDENAGLDLNEPLYMQKLEEVQPSPPFVSAFKPQFLGRFTRALFFYL